MRPWKSSKAKLEAVHAFRFGDQKHDGKYTPKPEPPDPPANAFPPVPGQGESSGYYGPNGPYGPWHQPSSPAQGQAPFPPTNANQNAYQNSQPYSYNTHGQTPAPSTSPEAGVQLSPPAHSSPSPPQQAHTRGPQRSLTYDNPYEPYEEPFAPPQRIQTEPPQMAPHDCRDYGFL
ncbi:hypothetical protein PtrSN002B_006905 [Pyrenophora tritici-repentis]|uniref:DUF1421 multi-domain protein n=1 Tax=Pyrenophora tritici-repentis TaxID=45151 RepID=A0A2W1H0I6_9PLEO|nr:hypothetical protein PtrV1_09909 [Pyrenophora tritici-repentis]KAF7445867.1 hypothetical protein A1F99_091580 [Pyrenophora tritici-repentis]KAF7566996.1 DUF1421 multi-domain protein [Pyrenophora tritici-repentis]KAG9381581.1 hypothetical protein A1F94_007235 [Pyrenophora tritici-repentis]KAI0577588.1 hypothetical protein Alg215_06834 [Pyrenophora tritici-repentis]